MLLTQLLYCSEHRYNLCDRVLVEQINNTVSISQRNNFKQSITGVLFADRSSFVQILEGNRETVVELFGKIKQDRRHFNVLLLSVQDISERRYGAWPMGCLQKTPSNAHLFAPYIMGGEFRPDAWKSSVIVSFLNDLSELGLKKDFANPIWDKEPRPRPLPQISLDVCDSYCNTRVFETEDGAATFISALKHLYPDFNMPCVIVRDPNGSSQFLIKILVADAQMLNFDYAIE